MPPRSPIRAPLALTCLFLSGCAGLVYEVCAIRTASLIFGSTTLAVSTVLAVFFGGLALGSWLFGALAARVSRPLRLYALLEIGIGLLAVLTPLAFKWTEGVYGHAYRAIDGEMALALTRSGLVALVLLPATILMGGTLPLFARFFVQDERGVARPVGVLYAVNTLGAAAGCAATGLWLLPRVGVSGALLLGAGMNVIAGVAVGALRAPALPIVPHARTQRDRGAARHRITVTAIFFVSGFAALGTEVLWTRYLALIVRNTVYTYTLTLTVVLTGIVLGSLLAARLFDRPWPRAALLGALQALTGLTVLFEVLLPPALWQSLGQELLVCVALMLVPAILSGASFPLAVRMVLDEPALAGRRVGVLLAVNTAGGLAGALLTGTIGLPRLGMHATLLWLSGLSVVCALLAWLFLRDARARLWPAVAAALVVGAAWLAIPRLLGTRIPQDHLGGAGAGGRTLIDHREGLVSTAAVVDHRGTRSLEIDRWWQGQDLKNHQIMAAHVPALLHADPRRVLVVGAGAGQTPGRFLMHGIERLDCVDIEPAVFDLIAAHFDAAWMADPRVRLIRDDGRTYLTHGEGLYDIISIEVGQLFRPGVATFYTADFYRRAAERLEESGLLVQFVPLPFFKPEEFRGVLATFLEVFPASVLWYNTSELLLIGAKGASPTLDPDRLRLLMDNGPLHGDLRYSYWGGHEQWLNRPQVFLAGFLCGPRGLAALAGAAAVYRDDRPVLEYAASRAQPTERREASLAELVRANLDPIETIVPAGLPPDMRDAAARLREQNLGDIAAGACVRVVELLEGRLAAQTILALVTEALKHNPLNVTANRMMGDVLADAGHLEAAGGYFQAALRTRSDDGLSHRGLAFVLVQSGHIEQALHHLRAAVELRPEDAVAHNYLGVALAQSGDVAAALPHFERAVELDGAYSDALVNLEQVRQALRSP